MASWYGRTWTAVLASSKRHERTGPDSALAGPATSDHGFQPNTTPRFPKRARPGGNKARVGEGTAQERPPSRQDRAQALKRGW